ncbi:MAG: outer membrane lipid asymmetry maintenance protein MlaD [Proteobacteria bacterium]|jgi:phospholipid/cholesterol/gamma-HCH transport system substrate-binding protein|nr:outer membrane lipid asymmetry maintenance protein MlaD [Pseudomonadota bacterium]
MKRSVIETVLGAVVLLVAAVFFAFAYSSADIRPNLGYTVKAYFNAIDGLTVGSDVRVGGVKVGAVTAMAVDQTIYRAVITMNIEDRIKLPDDTLVTISSDGMLGGKYVRLEPGKSKAMVDANGELSRTKDVVSLEELLGKVIFLVTDGG